MANIFNLFSVLVLFVLVPAVPLALLGQFLFRKVGIEVRYSYLLYFAIGSCLLVFAKRLLPA